MNLLFKFTLGNSIEGNLEIKEPEGWDDGVLKLERNKDYHSLVEYYSQPLIFDDAQADGLPGGLAYIKNIETTQGPDAQINITIEISDDDGDTYETCFIGVLDFDTLKEIDFYKLECGVKRDDFWSKFINRKSIPVDLQSITDLDGNARNLVDGFVLPLPSQKIRGLYDGALSNGYAYEQSEFDAGDYLQFDVDEIILDEIKTKFHIGNAVNGSIPVNIFTMDLDGTYDLDIRIEASLLYYTAEVSGSPPCDTTITIDDTASELNIYLQVNEDDPELFTITQSSLVLLDRSCWYTYTGTKNLLAGDRIKIYGDFLSGITGFGTMANIVFYGKNNLDVLVRAAFSVDVLGTCNALIDSEKQTEIDLDIPSGELVPTYFRITADTTYVDTDTDSYFLEDAGESILSKLVGADDVILSDYFNGGCGDNKYAIQKGLHVRGYRFDDTETSPIIPGKPFAMSFDNWWNGANPILNLGLGYESGNKMRIEQKSFFYDKTGTSVDLDFVNNIERSYAQEYIIKSIEMGYQKWSAESASGVDDPQSKRTWRTRFATIGKDEKILSEFIAASLAIEQTRRNRVEQGKDWRLDDDILIIAVDPDLSPLQPEFDENFNSVTGLLNSDARYNIRLSVARNFERWKEYFNGCLQWYVGGGEEFTFASGEGNYDMLSQLIGSDCEATGSSPEPVIDEKGNIVVTDDFYFMPVVYEFEHPITFEEYKLMRDNRTLAIGVSRTGTGHKKCFIMNLDYKPTHGLGTFTVILAENDPL